MIKRYFGSPEGLLIYGLIFINAVTTSLVVVVVFNK
jgi:hypothetical protein